MVINTCPKCGSKVSLGVIEKLNDYYIECPSCKTGGPSLFLGKEYEVVSKWNKYTKEIKRK